jgi:hypothetical protein
VEDVQEAIGCGAHEKEETLDKKRPTTSEFPEKVVVAQEAYSSETSKQAEGGVMLIFTPEEFHRFQDFLLQEKRNPGVSTTTWLNSSASNFADSVDSTIIDAMERNPNAPSLESTPEIGTTSNIVEPLLFNNCRVNFRKVKTFE